MGNKVKRKIKNYAGRNFKKERVPDKQSTLSRSSQMSKIRSKNTKFEDGFINKLSIIYPKEFITHVRTIKGTPDVVFEKEKVCVFLDSDFWHGWQYPRWKHLMKDDFWRNKIEGNRKRDLKTRRLLKKNGWIILRIWEHLITENPELQIQRIATLILSRRTKRTKRTL